MTLKLYFAPGACSFVPHVMLELTGEPYEPVLVKIHKDEHQGEAYKAINPRAQVPALEDGGAVVTQVLAIVSYLNDRFPQQGFIPREPLARARFMETLAWMNNTVHPTFTHVFMPWKYTDRPELHDALRRHAAGVYASHLAELDAMVPAAGDVERPWFAGQQLGPLDAYALTLTRWGSMAGHDPQRYGRLWDHVQRVAEHPAVVRAIERERIKLNMYAPPGH